MLTRRMFVKSGLSVGGASIFGVKGALANPEIQCPKSLGDGSDVSGLLVVISANADRFPYLNEGDRDSMLTVVRIESGRKVDEQHIPTRVTNAHDIVPFSGRDSEQRYIVVGKGAREVAHILGKDFESISYIKVPGITFRGHGIQYGDDVLVTAESSDDPMGGGKLLRISSDGVVKSQHSIGGLRPHHIVDAGDFFAVANYGDRPIHRSGSDAVRGMSADSSPTKDQHFFDLVDPSISIIDKETLDLVRKIDSPSADGAITHLDSTSDGDIYAIINQGVVFWDRESAFSYFSKNRISVPLYEKQERTYNFRLPLVKASIGGAADVIKVEEEVRDAQSVAADFATGSVVFTYPGSHTIKVIDTDGKITNIDSRSFGISQPRGCAKLDGRNGLFVVTGNDNSAAIFDSVSKALVSIVPASFSDHSHCRWMS